MRTMFRYLGTLFALQAVFSMIVFLLSDFRWLAMAFSLLFLGVVFKAGRSFADDLRGKYPGALALAVGLVWQLPGLQGTLRFISDTIGITQYDGVTDLMDFAMETWHTVLLPLLAAIPKGLVDGYYARYYIALVAGSPALILLFTLAATPLPINYLQGKRLAAK